MKALTLIQPWATAIARWGKDVENRSWEPPRDLLGKRFAIHAGKGLFPLESFAMFVRDQGIDPAGIQFDNLRRGEIVATVRLVGAISGALIRAANTADTVKVGSVAIASPWFVGEWGWVVDEPFALPEPVPCRGFQRLWNLPPDVEARVLEQEQNRG